MDAAITVEVECGTKVSFWSDRWLPGSCLAKQALLLIQHLTLTAARLSMAAALCDHAWVHLINHNLPEQAILEFLEVWSLVNQVVLSDSVDTFRWSWSPNGRYSATSAYAAFFGGREVVPCSEDLWSSRAPMCCRFFVWLVLQNRCWTTDRLAKRGLPHLACCPLCDQEPKTIAHLMLGCVFSRQVWAVILVRWGKSEWIPSQDSLPADWWSTRLVPSSKWHDLSTGIILVRWTIWKHRNAIVFDGARPDVASVTHLIEAEGRLWWKAGLFKGLGLVCLVGNME